MLKKIVLEKILNHLANNRLDPESIAFKSAVDFDYLADSAVALKFDIEEKSLHQLFFLLIEYNHYEIFKLKEYKELFNDFFTKYSTEELKYKNNVITEIIDAVIFVNLDDIGFFVNWLETMLLQTSKTIFDGNKHKRFFSVCKTISLKKYGLENSDFVWNLSFEQWEELIKLNLYDIEKGTLAEKLLSNYLSKNPEKLDNFETELLLSLFQKFKNVFPEKLLKEHFEQQIEEIKTLLPEKEAYKRLAHLMHLLCRENLNDFDFKKLLMESGISQEIFTDKYFNKYNDGLLEDVFMVFHSEKMKDIYSFFGIPYSCYYSLDMNLIPTNERKKALYQILHLEQDCSEDSLRKALYSDSLNMMTLDITLPKEERYLLISEFPEVVNGALLTIKRCNGKELDMLVSYILYSNNDLTLTEDAIEMLKLMYKK